MLVTIHVDCPYCNQRFKEKIEVRKNTLRGSAFLLCPPEEGGCDSRFAVNVKLYKEIATSELDFK